MIPLKVNNSHWKWSTLKVLYVKAYNASLIEIAEITSRPIGKENLIETIKNIRKIQEHVLGREVKVIKLGYGVNYRTVHTFFQ